MFTSTLVALMCLVGTTQTGAIVDCGDPVGADLVVSGINSVSKLGTVNDVAAFSVGTTVCNLGTGPNAWEATTAHHPVIIQNLYRLRTLPGGVTQYEQIGLSWAMHAIVPLSSAACCPCSNPMSNALAAGCSSTDSATVNAYQARLGPRLEIDASAGSFPYPNTFDGVTGDSVYKRMQVPIIDLDPAQNAGTRYFLEVEFLSDDDAEADNGFNNAGYREATVFGTAPNLNLSLTGSTTWQRAALHAWKEMELSVVETELMVPEADGSAGLVTIAANVVDLGNGTWNYEYAVHNMNSDRAVGSFSVPVDQTAVVSGVGFHDISFHSGDGVGSTEQNPFNMDGTDWPHQFANGALSWATVEPFADNPNGNAIRWGTVYNFRFTTNAPPKSGQVTLGLFTPGTPDQLTAATLVPEPLIGTAPGDFDGDGDVDTTDFSIFTQCFGGAANPPAAGCPAGIDADLDGDGDVDASDFGIFAQNFTGSL